MFGKLFGGKAKDAINQFSGNKDFLEGLCSACALTAAADGEAGKEGIDDAEYDATLNVIRANTAISAAFPSTTIEAVFGKMAPKTATRSGKAELMNEIREVVARDKTGAMGQAIVLAALDVADQGGISDKEVAVMRKIAEVCGVNYDKLANA
jgi:tellurite resistance protein